jgi:hypothetical protein
VDPIPVAELPTAEKASTSVLPAPIDSTNINASISAATLAEDASKQISSNLKPTQLDSSNKSSPEWDSVFEPFPESFKEHLYRQRRRTKLDILKKIS